MPAVILGHISVIPVEEYVGFLLVQVVSQVMTLVFGGEFKLTAEDLDSFNLLATDGGRHDTLLPKRLQIDGPPTIQEHHIKGLDEAEKGGPIVDA